MQPDRRGTIFEVGLPSTATKTTCNFRVKYDDFVIGDGAYNTPMESTAAVEAARSKGRAGMVVVGKTMRYTYDQLKMLYVHTLQAVPVNAVEEGGGGAKVMSTAQGTLSTTTTTTTTGVSKKGISRAMQFSPPPDSSEAVAQKAAEAPAPAPLVSAARLPTADVSWAPLFLPPSVPATTMSAVQYDSAAAMSSPPKGSVPQHSAGVESVNAAPGLTLTVMDVAPQSIGAQDSSNPSVEASGGIKRVRGD